jgi:lambda family phage portal protein
MKSKPQKLVDRALALFGLQRRREFAAPGQMMMRRTYSAARYSGLTADWSPAQTSANTELRWNLRALRNRARELARNEGVMTKFLSMLAMNVVGAQGIALRVKFDPHGNSTPERDQQLAAEVEAAFADWSRPENCTASGRLSWVGALAHAIRTIGRDGEFLCREIKNPPGNRFGYALQFRDVAWLDENWSAIASDTGNRILMSVEIDSYDRPVRYWLTRPSSDYLYPQLDPRMGYRTPAPASEIIHKFLVTEDELQTRGVPMCHAAMEQIHVAGSHVDAELYASRIGACITDWLRPPKDADELGGEEPLPPEFQTGAVRDLESGVAQVLPPGWDVTSNDPKHPNTNFAAFQKAIKREIASALGVSYVSLANDLEGVNYSSIRAGLIEERDIWRYLQLFMIEHFCHRVFQNWLRSAMLTKAVTLSIRDYERIRDTWRPRGWDWVDPLKDIQASILAVMNGFESRSDYCDERGEDFQEILAKLALEQKAMEAAGLNMAPPDPATAAKKPKAPSGQEQPVGGDQGAEDGGDEPARVLPIFESQLLPRRRPPAGPVN